MNPQLDFFLDRFLASFGGADAAGITVDGSSGDTLPSVYAVSDFAAASIATAGAAAQRLEATLRGDDLSDRQVVVDRRLASVWFQNTIEPVGWSVPGPWDAIAGNYLAQDRFVRLHTNAPAHRAAALAVLGCEPTKDAVAKEVATWNGFDLHEALVSAGGVGAALRTRDEWLEHPQGRAVSAEPLVHETRFPVTVPTPRTPMSDRPLAGVRVLDLTRVLAGPVATRFLAGLGADVLRVDPPTWDEPGVVPDVNRGKRCVRLDLKSDVGRTNFDELLASADIMVHGYRLGALEDLGYGTDQRRATNPRLIDVSLNAYGHTGPWAERRGFDSVVQVAAGIAAKGMHAYGTDAPKPLPVQALDHATGYTLAACAINGWHDLLATGQSSTWRTSLAAHGELLCGASESLDQLNADFADRSPAEVDSGIDDTSWGPARWAHNPVTIPGVALRWDLGSADHGSTENAGWVA